MAATDSAVALELSPVSVGTDLSVSIQASSASQSVASSVDSLATANAVISKAVGALDSSISVGGDATLNAIETGEVSASATTVTAESVVATTLGSGKLGDVVVDALGFIKGYITDATSGTYHSNPDGTGSTGTLNIIPPTGDLLYSSSAYAGFTGINGGIVDSNQVDIDDSVVIGDAASVTATVDNSATANAVGVAGGTVGYTNIFGSYGLYDVAVIAGGGGSLIANVDSNVVATATTVGGVDYATSAANALSLANLNSAVGIHASTADAGTINFGNDATISASAGTIADKLKVSASSASTTGDAKADAFLGNAIGIQTQIDEDQTNDKITVGDAGMITGLAYAALDATSTTTTGDAGASAITTNLSGIEAGTLTAGNDGVIAGQAGIASSVAATTVGSTQIADFTATANNTVTNTAGLKLEQLSVGNVALKSGSFGILGRTDANLITKASNVGDDFNDVSQATGELSTAYGIAIGDFSDSEISLRVGDNASVAGIADVSNSVTASSVRGQTYSVSNNFSVVGVRFSEAAEIGGSASLLGEGRVMTDATASTVGANGDISADATAFAGAGDVAGIQITNFDFFNGSAITSSFGNSATITGNANLGVKASATSVAGDSISYAGGTGIVDNLNLVGISFSTKFEDDTLNIGTNGLINATVNGELDASATTVHESAAAISQTLTATGLQSQLLNFGDQGTINAASSLSGTSTATTVGDASSTLPSATAMATAGTNIAADLNTTGAATTFGGDGKITATATSNQSASATSVAGAATGNAGSTTNIGLDSLVTTIGDAGTITANASQVVSTTATSTAAAATANAGTELNTTNQALISDGALSIGSDGTLSGTASLVLTATALTTGNSVTADAASANVGNSNLTTSIANTGLALDAATTTIGDAGTVSGFAAITTSATATGIQADAAATTNVNTTIGIDLNDQTFTVGNAGKLTAQATSTNTASAATIDGDAAAAISMATISGLGNNSGAVVIGNGGVVSGLANATNSATAGSIDADAASVAATVNNDLVQGINTDSISVGNGGLITGIASSGQSAIASNVGDPGTPIGEQAATASVGNDDQILGITSTLLDVGYDISKLAASAGFTGSATASNVTAASNASAGEGSGVIGLGDGSMVSVGNSATGGILGQGESVLTAAAISVEDDATANAGSTTSSVRGISDSNITVGKNAGTITALASSTLKATASTNGSAAGAGNDATATAIQTATGLTDSTVTVGANGNLTGSATLVGTAEATNTGNPGFTGAGDASVASLILNGTGISQAAQAISIGSTGNVIGQALVSGRGIAQSINGNASATGDIDATALNLNDDAADITIGQAGNVSGLAVIGSLSSAGGLGNQVQITAATTDGMATASGDFDATGIFGVATGDSSITAGPNDGDVMGQVVAGGSVVASNTGTASTDTAIAEIGNIGGLGDKADLYGIQNVDILGGQVGTNNVQGSALGKFDAAASSIKGDAVGISDVNAYGIFSAAGSDTINVNGGINAIAQLSNSVTATSISGSATATANSDAVALTGYNVTLIGSGSINASASSAYHSLASSTSGAAIA